MAREIRIGQWDSGEAPRSMPACVAPACFATFTRSSEIAK